MGGLEVFGWCILAGMVPGAIVLGMGLAACEHEHGAPTWLNKLAEWLVTIAEKF